VFNNHIFKIHKWDWINKFIRLQKHQYSSYKNIIYFPKIRFCRRKIPNQTWKCHFPKYPEKSLIIMMGSASSGCWTVAPRSIWNVMEVETQNYFGSSLHGIPRISYHCLNHYQTSLLAIRRHFYWLHVIQNHHLHHYFHQNFLSMSLPSLSTSELSSMIL